MVVNEKQTFLSSLATTAYWLVFGVHFTVFGLMLLRSIQGDTYELPLMTWAVWLVIVIGTPIAFFTPAGKTYQFRAVLTQSLLISARQKNPQTLELKFEDSAGGIPKGALERVFDPFYTTKEVGKGTGLGLSISYSIITDAGGTLSVKNTGVGAQFTILLPT